LHLVLEPGELGDDLLALVGLGAVVAGSYGAVGIINRLSLIWEKRQQADISNWEAAVEERTMMMGHRSRAVGNANDVGSPVE
jgi:hypothetical protein